MKTSYLIAALTTALVPAAVSAQVMAPAEYVMTAGAGDLYEVTSSRVVLQTTQNSRVREFANMMIMHHTKSTADLKAAAAKSRVRVAPAKLMPTQQEMVAQLTAEQGTVRDAAYVAQQKAAHGQALNVQKAYAMEGTNPALKAAATSVVPVVEQHIEMLKTM